MGERKVKKSESGGLSEVGKKVKIRESAEYGAGF